MFSPCLEIIFYQYFSDSGIKSHNEVENKTLNHNFIVWYWISFIHFSFSFNIHQVSLGTRFCAGDQE